jgi:hypothetical protein
MTNVANSPERYGAGDEANAPAQPRIFTNERGTFYMVASDAYWAARAAMIRHYGRPGNR